jgi:multidrug efflux pump subunit AcrA (membrane-fusion protein)
MRKYIYAIILALTLTMYFVTCGSIGDKSDRIQWGDFKATITETGELHAVNSSLVSMPFYDFWKYGESKVVHLQTEGTRVKKGDYVAQIDTTGVARHLKQTRAELAIAQADYKKLLNEQESTQRQLLSDLNSAKAALRLAVIDTQSVQFESPNRKERSRIEYRIAELGLQKIKTKIKYTEFIQKEDRYILEAKISNHERAIQKALITIDQFILRAPADGMIEYRRRGYRGRGDKVKIGDDLHPGEHLIGLPDLSKMKVLTYINETDIDKIFIGQKSLVSLDAYPQAVFSGEIIYISKTCREKDRDSKIKVFDVEIRLDKTDPILRPGMTVSCNILIAEFDNVFYLPHSYVLEEPEGLSVYVKRGARTKRIPVKLGPRNTKYVVVYGEFEKRDKLVLPLAAEDA